MALERTKTQISHTLIPDLQHSWTRKTQGPRSRNRPLSHGSGKHYDQDLTTDFCLIVLQNTRTKISQQTSVSWFWNTHGQSFRNRPLSHSSGIHKDQALATDPCLIWFWKTRRPRSHNRPLSHSSRTRKERDLSHSTQTFTISRLWNAQGQKRPGAIDPSQSRGLSFLMFGAQSTAEVISARNTSHQLTSHVECETKSSLDKGSPDKSSPKKWCCGQKLTAHSSWILTFRHHNRDEPLRQRDRDRHRQRDVPRQAD